MAKGNNNQELSFSLWILKLSHISNYNGFKNYTESVAYYLPMCLLRTFIVLTTAWASDLVRTKLCCKKQNLEFPGSPEARTLYSHC